MNKNRRTERCPDLKTMAAALLAAAMAPTASWALATAESPDSVLDAVVVSGTRVEHSSLALPGAVDTVGTARINDDQARVNLSEALAGVAGVTVLNRQNYAQDLLISTRGFGARSPFGERGLRLVTDGIPASMPDGQGELSTFNLDQAQRVEVLRGPLATLYGNQAGGVIQLFTQDGHEPRSLDSQVEVGSYGSIKADASAQGIYKGLGYVLDASNFHTDGFRTHSAATRAQTFAKLNWAPDSDSRLTLVFNGMDQGDTQDPLGLTLAEYKANPTGVDPAALTFDTRKSIHHDQLGLSYERRWGDDSLQLAAYTGERKVEQFQAIPKAAQASAQSPGGVIQFDRVFYGLSARVTDRSELAAGALTSTLGAEFESAYDQRKGYNNYLMVGNVVDYGVEGALRRNETDAMASAGVFGQTEWRLDRFSATAGLRYSRVGFEVQDHFSAPGRISDQGSVMYTHTTPVLALGYELTGSTHLYAAASQGFETPTMNDLFYSGSNYSFGFQLKPAVSTQYELGAKAMLNDAHRFDVAAFNIKTSNDLVVDRSLGGRTSYGNAASTLRQGMEASLDSHWLPSLSSRLAFTWLNAQFDAPYVGSAGLVPSGSYMPAIPRSTLFAELKWEHPDNGLHAALELVARDRMFVEDTNQAAPAPGYAVANVHVGLNRRSGALSVNVFARLDNALDRRYVGSVIVADSNGRYYETAPGRNFLMGAKLKYEY